MNVYIVGYILSESFQNAKYVLYVCVFTRNFVKLNHSKN